MLMTSVVTKTTAIESDGCDDDDDNDQDADGLEDARVKMVPKPGPKLTIPPLSGHQCV